MEYQVGDLIVGTVTKVKPFALFFQFENGAVGMCHISEISDSYIRDIEKYGVVGDQIKVKVIAIDPMNNFLRVSLKQVNSDERYSTHKNETIHNIPEVSSNDFTALKDRLNYWINKTKKVAEKEGFKK